MDKYLVTALAKDVPLLNKDIANGLACSHLSYSESYLDQVFSSASKGFPNGLAYSHCQRCTPLEEFAFISKKKGTKRTVDIAKSNIYLMKYYFTYHGELMEPRYIFLPYVDDAGFIHLGGARFNISPILSDRVISIGVSDIFVRLLRDRLTFKRTPHSFMMDGKREIVQVSHSEIYHTSNRVNKIRPTVKADSTLMHYLLCKYGFTDTFMKFGKCNPIVGGAEINNNVYPEDEWVICSSIQIKPKGFGRLFYEPSHIRLAFRRSEMTPIVKNMVAGFFYIVDHFPTRIKPSHEYLDSNRLWMILLGHIIFSGSIHEGKLYDDINDHISSLDEYLDNLIIYKLKDINVPVNDIYELFATVIEHFNDWLLGAADDIASMYNKELSIVYYVLYQITSAIFRLYFKLKAASKKTLSIKEINSNMNATLKTGLIFSITRMHGEVSTTTSSGDNKALKITSLLVGQESSNKLNARKKRTVINDLSKRLHVSVAEVGNSHAITKSDPSGRSKLNSCLQIGADGVVIRNPKFVGLLDDIQKTIQR
jgi:hypothetical protein